MNDDCRHVEPDRFAWPYFFFACDPEGVLEFASKSVEQVLGYSASSTVGRHYSEFLIDGHELNRGIPGCSMSRYPDTECQDFSCATKSRDGHCKIISVQAIIVSDGNRRITSLQGVGVDRTDDYQRLCEMRKKQRQLEEQTRKLNDRESAVLNSIMEGKLNKQIAAELSIGLRTVESTRGRLIRKLNADHFVDVVRIESERRLLKTIAESASNDTCD